MIDLGSAELLTICLISLVGFAFPATVLAGWYLLWKRVNRLEERLSEVEGAAPEEKGD